jgi:predicted ferric reductase
VSDEAARAHAERRNAPRHAVQAVVAWGLRSLLASIALVIVWVWLHGGGVSSVHTPAALLTSLGRITGLFGAYLLLLQVLLMARLPFLEWVAGFNRLTRWHRLNGKLCLALILAHVATIVTGYALTDRVALPVEVASLLRGYPGMVAALIGTLLLILVVVTSVVIVRRRLRYETWFLVHLLAYAGVFLTWFHQLPTGNDFLTNPWAAAFWTALYVATLQLVLLFRVAQPALRGLWHDLRVAEVIPEGPGVISLRITGRHLAAFNARAGQFFTWRFLDRERWREAHPFSLSAAPDGRSLRITVKTLGDFSSRLAAVKLGTRVLVEGPFGSFTDAVRTRDRVALIAGGVGITPIRALLEEMPGRTDDLALIYRATRAEDVLFRDELERLARARGVALHYVIGEHRAPGNERLLSAEHLRALLPDLAEREVYLCGPRGMMRATEAAARRLGVPRARIHKDDFAF